MCCVCSLAYIAVDLLLRFICILSFISELYRCCSFLTLGPLDTVFGLLECWYTMPIDALSCQSSRKIMVSGLMVRHLSLTLNVAKSQGQ